MSAVNALVGQVLVEFSITQPWNMSGLYVRVKDSALVAAPERKQLQKEETG
jgi:cephalosporin hydroxylase